MENAADYYCADENSFSSAFAGYYLENPQNLEQVNAKNIQDADLNGTLQDISAFARENNINVQRPNVADDSTSHWNHVTENEVDDVQNEAAKPKTHRQTKWGVNVFRGKFNTLHSKTNTKSCKN